MFALGIVALVGNVRWNWQVLALAKRSTQYSTEWLALYLGLELGAMSHSVSDWGSSTYKSFKKFRMSVWRPRAKMKKRKSTRRSKSAKAKSRG